MPNALITGITGQDGSYLAELLLKKGYHVYGLIRRASTFNDVRIKHLLLEIELIDADLLDQLSLITALKRSRADEVYNLAAMSFVGASFQQPVATGEYTALSVARMLEAVRLADWPIRFYQASAALKCLARYRRRLRMRRPLSTHAARMAWPSSTATGLP